MPLSWLLVRVADQHGLQAAARLQMALVDPVLEQLAHGLTAALERATLVEQRRDVERHLAARLVVGLGPARQHQRREHVVGLYGAADDVEPDRLGAVAMAALHDGLEHRQRALAERIEAAGRPGIALEQLDQARVPLGGAARAPVRIVQALGQHRVVHAGVLPQIEGGEVKAEGVDAPEQAAHLKIARRAGRDWPAGSAQISATSARNCAGDSIAVGAALVGGVQPLGDLRQQHPIGHAVMARGRVRACAPGSSVRYSSIRRSTSGEMPTRLALCDSSLRQLQALGVILADDHLLRARQGLADALGVHVGARSPCRRRPRCRNARSAAAPGCLRPAP